MHCLQEVDNKKTCFLFKYKQVCLIPSKIFLNGLSYCCNLCWEATLSQANDQGSHIPLEKSRSKTVQSSSCSHHLLSLFSLNLPMDNLCCILWQCSFTKITLLSLRCLPFPIFIQNKHPYRALFCQRNKPLLPRLFLCHEHFIPSYQPSSHLFPVLNQLPGLWLIRSTQQHSTQSLASTWWH